MNKNATINIKIPIDVDNKDKKFIFENINYRRFVWNKFVEKANEYYDNNENSYLGFRPEKFLKDEFFKNYETPNNIYDKYCVGISHQVSEDMRSSIKTILSVNKKNKRLSLSAKDGHFHYKKIDMCYGTFSIDLKPQIDKRRNNKFYSRLEILSPKLLKFRIRSNKFYKGQEYLIIRLNELLFTDKFDGYYIQRKSKNSLGYGTEYTFNDADVKTITFIHEMGKFYIQLTVKVNYIIDKSDINSRLYKIGGIDTGIHHPAIIWDGEKSIEVRMPQKICNRIHYLERRMKRLQQKMDHKYKFNTILVEKGMIDSPYSNNYMEIQNKFRKVCIKISRIRRQWTFEACNWIARRYETIIVDDFSQPDNKNAIMNSKMQKIINYNNRFHSMYYFNMRLKHVCKKAGTEYVKAPKNTTCTCSNCGHINPRLPLSQRIFICEKCGYKEDRDINAAKNCYNYL